MIAVAICIMLSFFSFAISLGSAWFHQWPQAFYALIWGILFFILFDRFVEKI